MSSLTRESTKGEDNCKVGAAVRWSVGVLAVDEWVC